MIKARGGKNGTLQAGQRKARFRRRVVCCFALIVGKFVVLVGCLG